MPNHPQSISENRPLVPFPQIPSQDGRQSKRAWSLLGAMLGTGVIGLLVLSSDPRERLMGGLIIGAFPGAMIGWSLGKRFGV